jgi:TQO small subunit DoxD.
MRPNPIADAVQFMTGSALFYVFIILVAASLVIAALNLSRDPRQRNLKDISAFVLRFFIGCMWWQQSLWKLPPTYTDHPDGSGGLRYWVDRMVDGAAFQIQSDFVHYVVQPNFLLFAPVVYATEVLIGVSLMTGTAVRLFGLIGAAMAINLWLGLYHARGEWPWTYFFLIVVQLMFVLHRAGRSLGGDALIARSLEQARGSNDLRARILALIT